MGGLTRGKHKVVGKHATWLAYLYLGCEYNFFGFSQTRKTEDRPMLHIHSTSVDFPTSLVLAPLLDPRRHSHLGCHRPLQLLRHVIPPPHIHVPSSPSHLGIGVVPSNCGCAKKKNETSRPFEVSLPSAKREQTCKTRIGRLCYKLSRPFTWSANA